VGDCTRRRLALLADTSHSGLRGAHELDNLVRRRGRPGTIVSDNGAELTSSAILIWSDETGVGGRCIAPGTPAERLRRELQRPPQGRAAQRAPVSRAAG
jgi:putative transposase